ncbi:MAG: UspA protein [Frankiales bacterium]|jgi:nucleotide-binding universal stress UspA family protein|nr:UspA protein [Frankiales bacterium]
MSAQMPGVVVGIDGSPASDAALTYAGEQAAARRLPLTVLHSWHAVPVVAANMWGPTAPMVTDADVQQCAQEVLDRAGATISQRYPQLAHSEQLGQGTAANALIAASESALLVVVGGRDRPKHEPGWLGGVPLRLVAAASCPVVVVPGSPQLAGDIVVGVDGSAASEEAVAFAFEEASRSGRPLRALHAIDGMGGLSDGISDEVFTTAERQLSEALAGWQEKYPDVALTRVVCPESPLHELRYASHSASLVVVGSHGRGFFLRHVLGSVSSALLRVSTCPVAVVGAAASSEPPWGNGS